MRGVLVLISGLICLAGFYYGFHQNQRLLEGLARPEGDLFGPPGGEVRALEIRGQGRAPIRMENKDGRWSLTGPLEGPADQETVAALLSALAGARPLEEVAEADPVEFGFAPPHLELVFLGGEGSEPLRIVQVGHTDAQQRGRYVRLQDRNEAYLLDRERLRLLTPDLFALSDKALLPPPGEGLGELAFQGPGGVFRLIREEGGWSLDRAGTVRSPADPYLVEEALELLARARISGFTDSTPPDAEALTLRLVYNDRTDWLRVWPPREGEPALLGRSSRQGRPFTAPAPLFRGLSREPGFFLDRRVLVFEVREAARLILQKEAGAGPLRLVVEKSERGIWRVVEESPGAPAVDQARGSALVGQLARLRRLAPAGAATGRPVLSLGVESASGELLAGALVWAPLGGRVVLRSLGRNRGPEEFFLAGAEVFEKLPEPWTLTNEK